MAYTVKQLSKLSGVSVRTLHFYDEIGLLKPAYYGDNKYRYYEQEQLLILQQILFFRELDFPLNDIQQIVSDHDFDKVAALQSHKQTLEKDLAHTQKMITTIDKTIAHLKGEITMRDEEFFYYIERTRNSKIQQSYEQLLVERGILSQEEINESWEKIRHWNKADWKDFENEGDAFNKAMVAAMHENLAPSSTEVQKLVKGYYQLISSIWPIQKENYIKLVQLYCEHPDFRKFYDTYDPQLLDFLAAAMKIFAEGDLT